MKKNENKKIKNNPKKKIPLYETLALAEKYTKDKRGVFAPSDEAVENAREWSEENKL